MIEEFNTEMKRTSQIEILLISFKWMSPTKSNSFVSLNQERLCCYHGTQISQWLWLRLDQSDGHHYESAGSKLCESGGGFQLQTVASLSAHMQKNTEKRNIQWQNGGQNRELIMRRHHSNKRTNGMRAKKKFRK